MSRTVLAVAALIGLISCGGGAEKPTKGAAASASPAAGAPRTATKSNNKKKTAAKPDTAPAKNPLTN